MVDSVIKYKEIERNTHIDSVNLQSSAQAEVASLAKEITDRRDMGNIQQSMGSMSSSDGDNNLFEPDSFDDVVGSHENDNDSGVKPIHNDKTPTYMNINDDGKPMTLDDYIRKYNQQGMLHSDGMKIRADRAELYIGVFKKSTCQDI